MKSNSPLRFFRLGLFVMTLCGVWLLLVHKHEGDPGTLSPQTPLSATTPPQAVAFSSPAPAVHRVPVMPPSPEPPPGYPPGANREEKNLRDVTTTTDPPRLAFDLTPDQRHNYESRVILGTDPSRKYQALRVEELWTRDANPCIVSRQTMVGDHLLVQLAPGKSAGDLQAALPEGFAIRKTLHQSGAMIVSFPATDPAALPAARESLAALKGLTAAADPDGYVQSCAIPNDPGFHLQWSLHNTGQATGDPPQAGIADADVDAPEAWDLRTDASGVKVAVIDTGVDYNHPDLDGNIFQNILETGLDGNGQDRKTTALMMTGMATWTTGTAGTLRMTTMTRWMTITTAPTSPASSERRETTASASAAFAGR